MYLCVQGSVFRVQGSVFRVQGLRFRVVPCLCPRTWAYTQCSVFRVQGSGFRVLCPLSVPQDLGSHPVFSVQGPGCRVQGSPCLCSRTWVHTQ